MIEVPEIDLVLPLVTDGDIGVNNLESARQRSWNQFWRDPLRPGIAEYIIEQEQQTSQFLSDFTALERLQILVDQLDRLDAESPRTALLHAQVSSMAHRFSDARRYLAGAEGCAELSAAVNRLSLSIDQACGANLQCVLEARRTAAESGRLEDLVPLGALYADLREFGEADRIYQRALRQYRDTSPFAMAWVCFQLGVLWGELVPETRSTRAAYWYRKAIEYVPRYVKARVHLSEICLQHERVTDAEELLLPAVSSGDPEVFWRLSDVMVAMRRFEHAEAWIQAARSGFEVLLKKHSLAFADHGAEFYSGSGNDPARAFELAAINLQNRPTLRAFEQAFAIAVHAGFSVRAFEILSAAKERWGATAAFQLSSFAG
jgi:tetratricopeptide (TPR) repeat protein